MSLESGAWWLVPLAIALICGLVCPMVGTLLILQQRVMGTNVMAFAMLPGMVIGQALGIAPQLGGLISATLTVTLVELWVESRTSGHALDALLFGDLLSADLRDLLAVAAGLPPMVLLLHTGFNQLAWLGIDPDMAADRELPVRRLRLLLAWLTAWIVTTATAAVGLALVMGLIYSPALLALRQASSLAPGPVTACCCLLLLLWRPRGTRQSLP
ncbi:MAG: metal ABC transporter permease [Cyanobacteria bacterium REEB417]|nr:metal ABC transporter permease [Cyanobacteria bacterium REEB417]